MPTPKPKRNREYPTRWASRPRQLPADQMKAISLIVAGAKILDAWRTLKVGGKGTPATRAAQWFHGQAVQDEYERQCSSARRLVQADINAGVLKRTEALALLTTAARKAGELIAEADPKTFAPACMALVAVTDRLSKLEDWDKQKPAGINVAVFMDLRGASPEARRSRLRQLTTGTGTLTEGGDDGDESEILDTEAL